MMRILILCTGNSARSQMAEGWLRSFDSALDVHSAGTVPAARVHPAAVEAMAEVGIDLSAALPKSVDRYLNESFDWVITVCDHANETCPIFTGAVAHRIHVGFEDPAAVQGTPEQVLQAFRRIRDQIRVRLLRFYREQLGPVLRDALPEDLDAVQALLTHQNLPLEGVAERFGGSYVVAVRDGVLFGVAGVEAYGRFGLLRSVAVNGNHQHKGLGQQLTRNRIDWAREHGIDSLYLLTTTAAGYFARQGFREVSRLAVPIEVRTSHEFGHVCPDSATVMEFRVR